MTRLLVVDDDDAIRRLIRLNLADRYEIFDTSESEHALALALEHKPDAILLDLRMPRYSGFQLCQTFSTFNSTQLIPILVVSGESGARTKELCKDLGAAAYFEKPIDFESLQSRLEQILQAQRKERRSQVRVRLRVTVRLTGTDQTGRRFDIVTTTENVGGASFLCTCAVGIENDSCVEVYLRPPGGKDDHVGCAVIIRSEWTETHYPRYGCRFKGQPANWVLQ